MLLSLKSAISSKNIKTLLISLLIFSLCAFISKRKTSTKSPNPPKSNSETTLSSPTTLPESDSYKFQLSILKRSFLLSLLIEINENLLENLVILIKKPLKDHNRSQRRAIRKDKEQYLKAVVLGIEQEKTRMTEIISTTLKSHQLTYEKFEKALEMYKNDHEVMNLLSISAFEPMTGQVPDEILAEQIIQYEAENFSNTLFQKYQVEDEVFEKWNIELADVHQFCKNHPTLKLIYQKRS